MIAAIVTFIIYVIVFGVLFWLCDYAAANFLPAEFVPKAHVILVILFALLTILLILSMIGAVAVPFPAIHPMLR